MLKSSVRRGRKSVRSVKLASIAGATVASLAATLFVAAPSASAGTNGQNAAPCAYPDEINTYAKVTGTNQRGAHATSPNVYVQAGTCSLALDGWWWVGYVTIIWTPIGGGYFTTRCYIPKSMSGNVVGCDD